MNTRILVIAIALAAWLSSYSNAEVLVYEGFQYETAGANRASSDLLHGQPNDPGVTDTNATGLGATWQDSTAVTSSSDLFMASGSLTFGDLPTSGNHVRGDTNLNNDLFSRPITASLSGGSEVWFSFLANKLQNNFSAAEGGIVIGNQAVSSSRILEDTGASGLQGFGVAPDTNGNNWTAYAWDGSMQTVTDAVLNVATNGSETNLLIGRIEYDIAGETDRYTLYAYDLTASGGAVVDNLAFLNQIGSSITIDVDETLLDTLSLTRQVNTAYDELRIGSNLASVLGIAPPPNNEVPEPASIALWTVLGLGLAAFARYRRRSTK